MSGLIKELVLMGFVKLGGTSDLRSVARLIEVSEAEVEAELQELFQSGEVEEPEAVLTAKVPLTLTELGKQAGDVPNLTNVFGAKKVLYKSQAGLRKEQLKAEMMASHNWMRMGGSFGDGVGEVLKTKYTPMGGFCTKCRMLSMNFKNAPRWCVDAGDK